MELIPQQTLLPTTGNPSSQRPWPSLTALNSSGYTGDGPGSRAWYLESGYRHEAVYDGRTWIDADKAAGAFQSLASANADAASKIAASGIPTPSVVVGSGATAYSASWVWWLSRYVEDGTVPEVATWGDLPSVANSPVGARVRIPRLCGHGHFYAMRSPTRWAVETGQIVVSDCGAGTSTAGYDLVATGTAFVALASYTLPAGMIGDGGELGR